eukprot:489632-Hanusia_phi.AAC.1
MAAPPGDSAMIGRHRAFSSESDPISASDPIASEDSLSQARDRIGLRDRGGPDGRAAAARAPGHCCPRPPVH